MLSMSHSQAYLELLILLKKLNNDFLLGNDEIDIKSAQKQFQTMKIFFQQQIAGLSF